MASAQLSRPRSSVRLPVDLADDLLVGAISADPGGTDRAGETYVLSGVPPPPSPPVPAISGFTFAGLGALLAIALTWVAVRKRRAAPA